MMETDVAPNGRGSPGEGRCLCGDFEREGYAIEWHRIAAGESFEWSETCRPGSVVFCLNLEGEMEVVKGRAMKPMRVGRGSLLSFHQARAGAIRVTRDGGARHHFLTVSFAVEYLRDITAAHRGVLNPVIREWLYGKGGRPGPAGIRLRPMAQRDRDFCRSMLEPAVDPPVRDLWYSGKVTEFAAVYLFEPERGDAELFCARQKRIATDRVEAVRAHLVKNLDKPLSLKEMAVEIGCSCFYLSRSSRNSRVSRSGNSTSSCE